MTDNVWAWRENTGAPGRTVTVKIKYGRLNTLKVELSLRGSTAEDAPVVDAGR